jgi:hypothetical protein
MMCIRCVVKVARTFKKYITYIVTLIKLIKLVSGSRLVSSAAIFLVGIDIYILGGLSPGYCMSLCSRLILNLEFYSVKGSILNWFKSHLHNRRQRVVLHFVSSLNI